MIARLPSITPVLAALKSGQTRFAPQRAGDAPASGSGQFSFRLPISEIKGGLMAFNRVPFQDQVGAVKPVLAVGGKS